MIEGLLLGWLIADLASGVLHWIEDRVLFNRANWIGRQIVAPNRLHHTDPMAFLRSGIISRNSTTWPLVIGLALIWLWLGGLSWVLVGAFAGGMLVNEVHGLTHRPPHRDSLLRGLQEIGIIQSVSHHARHHAGSQDRAYCILTNWLNPLLDRAGIWPALESALDRIGIPISRGKA